MVNDLQILRQVVSEMHSKVENIHRPCITDDEIEASAEPITRKIEVYCQKINWLTQQVKEALSDHDKIEIMADIIVRQDQRINELNEHILDMQSRSMKRNIIINGLQENKDEECDNVSSTFFKEKLKVQDIVIDAAHRIGTGENRPMVLRLKAVANKSKVFDNVKKLKGVKNYAGKFYQIDNQMPTAISESCKQMFLSGHRHATISLIFMSTHKATAARCLRYHQATYGQPPSAWPL